MDEDDLFGSHPDLMDPEWRKHAQTDAWLGTEKDRKKFRKQQRRGGRQPRGRWWGFAAFLAVLAVTTTLIVLAGRRPAQDTAAPDPAPVPAVAAPNPTSVAAVAPVDLARPYAHTPADIWPKGMDGITSPAAAAVGAFKAAAVADAYAKVRQAIAAANLDPALLYRHDPAGFLAQFAPDDRAQLAPRLTKKPSKGDEGFDAYVTEIADGYHLLDAGPRTFGTLTAHAGDKPGELAVDAKYVVAYAFDNAQPQALTSPNEIVSFLRVDETYVVATGSGLAKSSRGLWIDGGQSALWSVGCAAAKEGYLAPGYANPPTGAPGAVDQDAPGYYDPKYPVPTLDDCSN
ncbi:hypothetical protein AB0F15_27485 [Amycolatopsis sp. NPDC026612]|uniref:hypothetical protein n=1 Tax=Amycolatopsis sp. NPDC026612 TaxID=3155466 RepID=UPI0033E6F0EB